MNSSEDLQVINSSCMNWSTRRKTSLRYMRSVIKTIFILFGLRRNCIAKGTNEMSLSIYSRRICGRYMIRLSDRGIAYGNSEDSFASDGGLWLERYGGWSDGWDEDRVRTDQGILVFISRSKMEIAGLLVWSIGLRRAGDMQGAVFFYPIYSYYVCIGEIQYINMEEVKWRKLSLWRWGIGYKRRWGSGCRENRD